MYDSLVLSSEHGEKYSGRARRSRSCTSSRLNHAACEGIVVGSAMRRAEPGGCKLCGRKNLSLLAKTYILLPTWWHLVGN